MPQQEHVVTLETSKAIKYEELVENATQMRPDRLIFGNLRGGEGFNAVTALGMGFDGSLIELTAKNTRAALARLELLCRLANVPLSDKALREFISSVIDLIVVQRRLPDGSRKIVEIAEVQGVEGDEITLATLFEFQQTSFEAGKIIGRIRRTGIRPNFIERIEEAGIHLPPSIFGIDPGKPSGRNGFGSQKK
jgi:pilus assembly protein CpaF